MVARRIRSKPRGELFRSTQYRIRQCNNPLCNAFQGQCWLTARAELRTRRAQTYSKFVVLRSLRKQRPWADTSPALIFLIRSLRRCTSPVFSLPHSSSDRKNWRRESLAISGQIMSQRSPHNFYIFSSLYTLILCSKLAFYFWLFLFERQEHHTSKTKKRTNAGNNMSGTTAGFGASSPNYVDDVLDAWCKKKYII
jgi:hypothetical protein